MALRVLLADESTTIKKVMQLALQDFAVEVKAVHAGVDVLDVARAFKPDIIFADVLLQKKNGYEVAAAIKNDRELREIPVVLMWSSFMDLDDAMARSSGAEARLEKPFDVETLRKQLLELVPKTRSQRLAHFLDFSPKLNLELQEDPATSAPAATAGRPTDAAAAASRTPDTTSSAETRAATPDSTAARPQTQASAGQAPSGPRSGQVPGGQPASGPIGGQPTAGPVGGQPAGGPAVGQPASGPIGGRPTVQPAGRKGPPPADSYRPGATRVGVPTQTQAQAQAQPQAHAPAQGAAGQTEAQAAAQRVAPPSAAAKSSWTMESFDDPSNFEPTSGEPELEEESFQPLELSQLAGAQGEPEEPLGIEQPTPSETDEDEGWARQDLSQFKLDLPPVTVGDEFKIDMGEEEFSTPNFETEEPPPATFDRRAANPQPAPQPQQRAAQTQQPKARGRYDEESTRMARVEELTPDELSADEIGNDLTLSPDQIESSEEIPMPIQPLDIEEPLELTRSSAAIPREAASAAGPLTPEELERIIRAQSREIIEQVVRKLVPDLAATIIREELERLLEDTAVREGKHP